MHSSQILQIIENNHLQHFQFLPNKLGFKTQYISQVAIINSNLPSSMFNIAYGLPQEISTDVITQIKQAFNGHPFAWWIPPSQHRAEFSELMLNSQFKIEAAEYAMICELSNINPSELKTNLSIKIVDDEQSLQDFITIISHYDEWAAQFFNKLQFQNGQFENSSINEKLIIGYVGGQAIGIASLLINGENAAIFNLITLEGHRCKGYGSNMMHFLLNIAKQNKCRYISLSASSDSGYRIYQKLGFERIGQFECFEFDGINKQYSS